MIAVDIMSKCSIAMTAAVSVSIHAQLIHGELRILSLNIVLDIRLNPKDWTPTFQRLYFQSTLFSIHINKQAKKTKNCILVFSAEKQKVTRLNTIHFQPSKVKEPTLGNI